MRWLDILAWVVIGWVMIFSFRVEANKLTEDQAALLYAIAYGQAGAGVPETGPEVHVVSQEQLEALICEGRTCGVRAAQVGDVVFLREDLDMHDPINASILLHELVHYVQWAKYGMAKDCADFRQREIEAYRIQFAALARIGVRPPKAVVPVCS